MIILILIIYSSLDHNIIIFIIFFVSSWDIN